MGPAVPGLAMDLPVLLGNVLGIENAVLLPQRIALGKIVTDEGRIDGPVDDRMGHMDAPGPQFPGHALGQGAQGELGPGKGAETAAATQGGGSAGEDDGAPAPGQHGPGRLAPGQEAGQGGHFPDLAIDPLGGFGNAEAHVGADIEHCHFDGAYVPLDMLEQLDHGLLAPCIAAEGVGSTTFVLDSRHQRFKLVRLPAGDAEGVPLTGEAAGDGAAGGIARTYDHGYWGSGHESSSLVMGSFKELTDRKSTRLNSSHVRISYAVFCLKKK